MLLRRYHGRRNEQQVEEPVVSSENEELTIAELEESMNKLELDELKVLAEELELEVDSDNKADYIAALIKVENLEEVLNDLAGEEIYLEEMTVEELIEYAKENNIDIGRAKTHSGIMQKILDAEDNEEEPVVSSENEEV